VQRRGPSKNQAHRFTQREHLLPVNLLLGPRHEHGADPGALRPEGIGPQTVADKHGILCPEPRQVDRRLVNAHMRFPVTGLSRRHENVDVTRQSRASEISGQVPAQLEHSAMANPARFSLARQSAAVGRATMEA
jgi:hypothetical protein